MAKSPEGPAQDSAAESRRLDSWKEIASFLGRGSFLKAVDGGRDLVAREFAVAEPCAKTFDGQLAAREQFEGGQVGAIRQTS